MNKKERLWGKALMKRIGSLLLILAMVLTTLPFTPKYEVEAAGTGTTLYLQPNDNWKEANARFALYYFQGSSNGWISMSDSDSDGIYEGVVPEGYSNIIFCRMNPSETDNNWSNKWNQTADLTVPTNGDNCYAIAEGTWDNGGGTWSKITSNPGGSGSEGDDTATYTATIHFVKNHSWKAVNLYTWVNNGAENDLYSGSYPGTKLSKDADGYYSETISFKDPKHNGFNFILNNGSGEGSEQTIDLNLPYNTYFNNADKKAEVWVELTAMSDGKYNATISSEKIEISDITSSPVINADNSVTFYYKNTSATSVEVKGDFNDWKGGTVYQMTKNASAGVWSCKVSSLSCGIHQYKFFVNGNEWITDPCNSLMADGNSAFTVSNPSAVDENEITVNIYYTRADGQYTVPNVDGDDTGVWNASVSVNNASATRKDFEGYTDDGAKLTMTVNGRETRSLKIKTRLSTASREWMQQEEEQTVDLLDIVSGTVNVYLNSEGTNGRSGNVSKSLTFGNDIVACNKITEAQYDYDKATVSVKTLKPLSNPEAGLKLVGAGNSEIEVLKIEENEGSYVLTLNESLDLKDLSDTKVQLTEDTKHYGYSINCDNMYASDKFEAEYTYTGDDLGATYSEESTTFKVWAPTAKAVKVQLYATGSDDEKGAEELGTYTMSGGTKDDKGVWTVTVNGDLKGKYYTYKVTVNGKTIEAVDPYARTTGVNGKRGMVIDLNSTNPKSGWNEIEDQPESYTDATIYELHVRDFSIDDSSGVKDKWQGKFMALTEEGTTVNGVKGNPSTGLDYMKEMGFTHLHLLPIYDYGSVDETKCDTFNWGYDPVNYNTPEGSYSTDPYNGEVRVKEMKEMVDTLHKNNIGVIMDVVYNHVYNADEFSFNQIVPGYFSRVNSNASGCGNDTASERAMVRKFIVDSVVYWAKEYHLDGFRFDLVGLLDTETVNEIVNTVHEEVREDIIFYGEGWDMDGTNKEPGTEMAKQGNASKTPGFAYFSDSMRNLLGGNNGNSVGFVSGANDYNMETDLVNNFMGKPWWTNNPSQVVQYASCHDNYTLIDKLVKSTGASGVTPDIIKMNNLAASIYMTSQGIPFIHAGEEMLREKIEADGSRCENSYNASDAVNSIKWDKLLNETYAKNSEYYQGLIAFRKAHPALSLSTSAGVGSKVVEINTENRLVSFRIDGGVNQSVGEDGLENEAESIFLIFNANNDAKTVDLPEGSWRVYINATNAGTTPLSDAISGTVEVPAISAMVLVKDAYCSLQSLIASVESNFEQNIYQDNYTTATVKNLEDALADAKKFTDQDSEKALKDAYDALKKAVVGMKSMAYTVTLNADPVEGGTLSGEGAFASDEETTIKAEVAAGYKFVGWYDAEEKMVSENASYTVSVDTVGRGAHVYTAKFEQVSTDDNDDSNNGDNNNNNNNGGNDGGNKPEENITPDENVNANTTTNTQKTDKTVRTGDQNNGILWMALLIMSIVVVVGAVVIRRKRQRGSLN